MDPDKRKIKIAPDVRTDLTHDQDEVKQRRQDWWKGWRAFLFSSRYLVG